MAQGIPLSPPRSISFHFPVKISSLFPFLQVSQTQISSSVLPDIWYLYLIISFKNRLLMYFPMPAPGRPCPAGDPYSRNFAVGEIFLKRCNCFQGPSIARPAISLISGNVRHGAKEFSPSSRIKRLICCETNFVDHNFDPLTSHFLKTEKLMGYLIAFYFPASRPQLQESPCLSGSGGCLPSESCCLFPFPGTKGKHFFWQVIPSSIF
ncbi:MAG: hypothetical protein AB1461_07200 [Thermodesulfobacteriota bacterium]